MQSILASAHPGTRSTGGSSPVECVGAVPSVPVPAANRRQLCIRLLSIAAATACTVQPEQATAAPGALTPYERQSMLQYGLREDGRLRSCPTDVQPNCVSSSSTNDTYLPAWEAPLGSPAQVAAEFEAALVQVEPAATVVGSASGEGYEYRRYVVPDFLFDHDDIELLVSRRADAGADDPPLVTIRSLAAQVKYIWPITQPISDGGAQRKRLKAVRQRLGWRLLGCDLLECFEE